MRTVQSASASPELRPYVRAFAQRTAVGVFEAQPLPAYLETVVHFDFGDLTTVKSLDRGAEPGRPLAVVGPSTFAGTTLGFKGEVDSFAIFLQPAGLWSLFRVPISVVTETHYDAEDVLGAPAVGLWHALAETSDFARRVRLAEAFLHKYANLQPRETVGTAAATILARCGGRITVDGLASKLHLSPRQLERTFLRDMGISPKRFARVARFQAALDARVRSPNQSWLDIATASGYHDQMHLNHEFQSFGGLSPTLTVQRLGDSRPSSQANSNKP